MAARKSFHENLTRSDEVKGSSNRSFGLVFACVFTIIGLWSLYASGSVRLWALAVGAVFLIAALAKPDILAPLNRLWLKFGALLHKIVNPIIMGILFFITVTPIALISRIVGKKFLHTAFEPGAESYWILREPPGPEPEDMNNQF